MPAFRLSFEALTVLRRTFTKLCIAVIAPSAPFEAAAAARPRAPKLIVELLRFGELPLLGSPASYLPLRAFARRLLRSHRTCRPEDVNGRRHTWQWAIIGLIATLKENESRRSAAQIPCNMISLVGKVGRTEEI